MTAIRYLVPRPSSQNDSDVDKLKEMKYPCGTGTV